MAKSPISKVLLALRHGIKGGLGEYGQEIGPNFLNEASRMVVTNLDVIKWLQRFNGLDLFGSAIARSWQELLQICSVLSYHRMRCQTHDPLPNLGNDAMFRDWANRGLAQKMEETGSEVNGLRGILEDADFRNTCAQASLEIGRGLNHMQYDYAVGVFHSPTIQLAALGLGYKFDGNLACNDGLIFVLRQDYGIECLGLWKDGLPLPMVGSTD